VSGVGPRSGLVGSTLLGGLGLVTTGLGLRVSLFVQGHLGHNGRLGLPLLLATTTMTRGLRCRPLRGCQCSLLLWHWQATMGSAPLGWSWFREPTSPLSLPSPAFNPSWGSTCIPPRPSSILLLRSSLLMCMQVLLTAVAMDARC
jgi:hypothetical protein